MGRIIKRVTNLVHILHGFCSNIGVDFFGVLNS